MSEYQYYEFRALDRSLTSREMASLRAISSRADITAMSFVNVYNYGDFRGDPGALMEKFFDAFLYVANWGTHEFMLRLPNKALDRRECARFCAGESLTARSKAGHTIFRFRADELETDWEEGEGWMDSLLPIREEFLRGDFRALYLGWLLAVQNGDADDDQPEPPLPAGLRHLSKPLGSLREFLGIDPSLLDSAAELRPEARRTAGQLRVAAEERVRKQKHRETERRRVEQEREAQRKASERTEYLEDLEKREKESWIQLEDLVGTKRPKDYDRAVSLLADLRDLAELRSRSPEFQQRFDSLTTRHSTKSSFLQRLKKAGLKEIR